MPEIQNSSEEPEVAEGADVSAQVASLKKVVALLVLVCLAVSACLNIYMVAENAGLRRQVASHAERARGVAFLYQFCQRIVADLKHLSETDQTARQLLAKYQQYIHEFNLDEPTRGAPGP